MKLLTPEIVKNILIVNNNDITLFYLKKYLSNHNYLVSCLVDAKEIPKKIKENKKPFDLLLLNVDLPSKDGFYWLNWITNHYPMIFVILISENSEKSQRLYGLKNGAKDYLIKPFHKQELLIRIGNLFNQKQEIIVDNLILEKTHKKIFKNGCDLFLTELELNILKLLYLNSDNILSRDEIMLHTRGVKHSPLDRSIDVHINKIRKKIEENPSKPIYIQTARGKGYYFSSPILV